MTQNVNDTKYFSKGTVFIDRSSDGFCFPNYFERLVMPSDANKRPKAEWHFRRVISLTDVTK